MANIAMQTGGKSLPSEDVESCAYITRTTAFCFLPFGAQRPVLWFQQPLRLLLYHYSPRFIISELPTAQSLTHQYRESDQFGSSAMFLRVQVNIYCTILNFSLTGSGKSVPMMLSAP